MAQHTTDRPAPQDHLLSRKKPNTKKVRIALDPDVADRYEAAQEKYSRAKTLIEVRPEDATAIAGFDEAEAELREAEVMLKADSQLFVFRSIGRKPFEALVAKHPPTDEQQRKAKKEGDGTFNWNPDTFPVALMAASIVEPALSQEEIQDIWDSDDWNAAEQMTILAAALEANQSRRNADLPKD